MLRARLGVLVLILVLTACAPPVTEPPTPQPAPTVEPTLTSTPATNDAAWVEAESYAVYEVVFLDEYGSKLVTLNPLTMAHSIDVPIDEYLQSVMPQLQLSTVKNYNIRNKEAAELQIERLSPDYRIKLLSESAFQSFFNQPTNDNVGYVDPWEAFYESYPNINGYLTVSSVGFSDDGTQALLAYDESQGLESCIWQYLLLEKANDEWEIVAYLVGMVC